MFIIAAAINPIAVHNGATVLFYINDRPFTLEATLYGLTAAGMISAALYRLRCLTKDLTSDKEMYILGRAFPKLGEAPGSEFLEFTHFLSSEMHRALENEGRSTFRQVAFSGCLEENSEGLQRGLR